MHWSLPWGASSQTFETVQRVKAENQLVQMPFTSVSDYIFLLRGCCQVLNEIKQRAIVYLAAAVSDYYTPYAAMADVKCEGQ